MLAIQKCQNDRYIAVITGKNLIRQEQKFNQLFLFRRNEKDTFDRFDRIILKDIPEFKKVSMDFYFVNGPGLERESLMFAQND